MVRRNMRLHTTWIETSRWWVVGGGWVVCDHTGWGWLWWWCGGILNIALFGVLKRVFKNPPFNGQTPKIMRAIFTPKMSLFEVFPGFGQNPGFWGFLPFLGFFDQNHQNWQSWHELSTRIYKTFKKTFFFFSKPKSYFKTFIKPPNPQNMITPPPQPTPNQPPP